MVHRRLVALFLTITIVVTACGGNVVLETSDDTAPLDESTTTLPQRDYAIEWSPCPDDEELDCGRLAVPYDYAQPDLGDFSLYVVRRPAADPAQRIGSMLVNPGGPGFGGSDVAANAFFYFSPELLNRFDIIGWDPRGTGKSTPAIDCIDDYDKFFGVDSPPNDEAATLALIDLTREYVDACVERSGAILPYVSTVASATDMDSLRRALGEEKITYFGFSYGSELGATWLSLFPDTVRAAVLDGATDFNSTSFDQSLAQLKGFESQLDAFFAACAKRGVSCPIFNGGDPGAFFDELSLQIDAEPLIVRADRTPVTQGVFYTAVAQALYSSTYWSMLERALADAAKGDGSGLLSLYDEYMQCDGDGRCDDTLEAFMAISCLDDPGAESVEEVNANLPIYAAAAKRLGEGWGYGYTCALWPERAAQRPTLNGAGAPPVVVIGTTGDAATPLDSTRKAAAALQSGALVIVDAAQHTGYGANACIIEVTDTYLTTLTVPRNELLCAN